MEIYQIALELKMARYKVEIHHVSFLITFFNHIMRRAFNKMLWVSTGLN